MLFRSTHRTRWWAAAAYTYTLDTAGNRVAVAERVLGPSAPVYLPVVMKGAGGVGEGMMGGGEESLDAAPLPEVFESPLLLPEAFESPLDVERPAGRPAQRSVLARPLRDSTYPAAVAGTRVISYTYDPLNRLIEAAYSSGERYRYSYDALGVRPVYPKSKEGG